MRALHWISADSWRRFIVSLVAALITFLALCERLTFPTSAIAAWDSFATFASSLAWLAIGITPQKQLREHARTQDLSRALIFGFVVAAACVALLAVAVLIRSHHSEMKTGITVPLVLALGTVGLSWGLLHTLYSLHYAHVYYGDADPGDERYSAAARLSRFRLLFVCCRNDVSGFRRAGHLAAHAQAHFAPWRDLIRF